MTRIPLQVKMILSILGLQLVDFLGDSPVNHALTAVAQGS